MIGDSNPSMGVSPPDAGDSDTFVISFYDTDDPENTKDDPVVEKQYELSEAERAAFESEAGVDSSVGLMLMDREELYEILDEVTE